MPFEPEANPTTPSPSKVIGDVDALRIMERMGSWSLVSADVKAHSPKASFASSPRMMALRSFAQDLLQATLKDTENPLSLIDEAIVELKAVRCGRRDE